MSLEKIRAEIDEIDKEIVRLLSKRMQLALNSKKYKVNVEDVNREKDIKENLKRMSVEFRLDYNYLKKIYDIVFFEGKNRQKSEW